MSTCVRCVGGILVGLLLIWSCGGEDGTQVRLSSEERRLIDTLFLQQVKENSPILDSICDANFAEQVNIAVDSIVKIRKEEERMLRERMLKKNEK